VTNILFSKYFPPAEINEDQGKSDENKSEDQLEQVASEDKTEGTKKTQSDEKMIDSIESELEVEAEDQSKAEEGGQKLSDLPSVPTTEPSEHSLPEAKKLKLNDD
jgi:hypothetical protein